MTVESTTSDVYLQEKMAFLTDRRQKWTVVPTFLSVRPFPFFIMGSLRQLELGLAPTVWQTPVLLACTVSA